LLIQAHEEHPDLGICLIKVEDDEAYAPENSNESKFWKPSDVENPPPSFVLG